MLPRILRYFSLTALQLAVVRQYYRADVDIVLVEEVC